MYKNLLHFFTQMIDYQRKQSYLQLHQKNKIPRKKYNQEGEICTLETVRN